MEHRVDMFCLALAARTAANHTRARGLGKNLSRELSAVVARTGFEPVISALRGRCPWPLDERATLGQHGGWGSRIRTSTYRSRVCRPTIRRIPTVKPDFTKLPSAHQRILMAIGSASEGGERA